VIYIYIYTIITRNNSNSQYIYGTVNTRNYKKGALDSQPQVIKFTSCLPMVGCSLRVLKYHQHHENMNEVDFDTVSFHYVICCYGCVTLYIAPGSYFIFCLYLTCVVVYIWIVVMFIWHFSYVLRFRLISTSRNLTELPMSNI
jgi:hypothetical protein